MSVTLATKLGKLTYNYLTVATKLCKQLNTTELQLNFKTKPKMKTLQELQSLILAWADEKNLLNLENAPKQRLKLLEEIGETSGAILKNKPDEIKDGLGDIFVVLIILAEQLKEDIAIDDKSVFVNSGALEYHVLFGYILQGNNYYFSISYLSDICDKLGYNLLECANLAWNEIKDRKGKTVDGTFIKN